MKDIPIHNFTIGPNSPFSLICGPCVIEGESFALETAHFLKELCIDLGINLIYKSSYDKANRTSIDSYRGPGLKQGLHILSLVKETYDVPIITDVHTPDEAKIAAEVCDIIQIPAFLCRQTDLIVAASKTGAVINLKKGQFMAPWDMKHSVEKIASTGNDKIIITDRGTSFGYNNLVSDMRSIPIMQEFGYPVCFDASHSVLLPGKEGSSSGGDRRFIPTLSRAAIAAGANCLFLEAHPHPEKALCDAKSVYPFSELRTLLTTLSQLYTVVQSCEQQPSLSSV